MSDLVGQTVGNYQIRSLIGTGGMGTVYLGTHRTLPRKAAIKVMRREFGTDPSLLRRFQEEAIAASAVVHPNIVDVQDVGSLPDGLPFTIMEYLPGESLGRRLTRIGTMTVAQALAFTSQAAAGLQAVHDKGIVHRDLKPDNLFLTPDPVLPDGERVKVLDFGIAKLRGELKGASHAAANTRAGALLGTPLYMSPEQCRGLTEGVDHRSDIYTLGVILYEMLCGQPPFRADAFGDLLMLHMSAPPAPPSSRAAGIPAHVENAILRCLAKRPADRFASMKDLRCALEPSGGETVILPSVPDRAAVTEPRRTRLLTPVMEPVRMAHKTTLSETAAESLRVHRPSARTLAVVGGACAVLAVGVMGGMFWQGRDSLGRQGPTSALRAPGPALERAPAPLFAPVPPDIMAQVAARPDALGDPEPSPGASAVAPAPPQPGTVAAPFVDPAPSDPVRPAAESAPPIKKRRKSPPAFIDPAPVPSTPPLGPPAAAEKW